MTAPAHEPGDVETSHAVRKAGRAIAAALLGQVRDVDQQMPGVPAWQAWAFTAWVVAVAGAYWLLTTGWLQRLLLRSS